MLSRCRVHDDELTLTQIADTCRWYATAGPPTAQREAAALARLTAGQTSLLARYVGQLLHQPTPGPDSAARDRAFQLCITAGAGTTLIER